MKKDSKLSDYVVLRKWAILLWKGNRTQTEIDEFLGVSQSSVSGWIRNCKEKEGSPL